MANKEKQSDQKPEKPRETTAEFIASMASVLVIGLFIITFCLQAFEIPSSSMENTLLIGDHVFVDRVRLAPESRYMDWLIPYRQPHRGDIVVFLSPETPDLYVVKRVIGVPGDHIHLRDGKVYVNGQLQTEPYVIHSEGNYRPYRDNFPAIPPSESSIPVSEAWAIDLPNYIVNGDIVVPPNSYFGMGDNRDVSYDSRYWGFIPQKNIIGRPMFIYWSFRESANQYLKQSIGDRLAFAAKVIVHFFDETRWSRMFHVVH